MHLRDDDDSQNFEEYDDAYNAEWYEWDYSDESYGYGWLDGFGDRCADSEWTEHDANSVPATGSITVDPLAATQQVAAHGAPSSTHHPPVASNASASGTAPQPTTVAMFEASTKKQLGNPFIMPVLMN